MGTGRVPKHISKYRWKFHSMEVRFPTILVLLWSLPGPTLSSALPIFWFGPNFHHHQTCRAWMSVRLPFRNTYHKGFSLFMGQTRYHASDENSCLYCTFMQFIVSMVISVAEQTGQRWKCSIRFSVSTATFICVCKWYERSKKHFTEPSKANMHPS